MLLQRACTMKLAMKNTKTNKILEKTNRNAPFPPQTGGRPFAAPVSAVLISYVMIIPHHSAAFQPRRDIFLFFSHIFARTEKTASLSDEKSGEGSKNLLCRQAKEVFCVVSGGPYSRISPEGRGLPTTFPYRRRSLRGIGEAGSRRRARSRRCRQRPRPPRRRPRTCPYRRRSSRGTGAG